MSGGLGGVALGVVGFALVEGEGVAVGVGDEGQAADGVVLDVHDDVDALLLEVVEGLVQVGDFEAGSAAVGVGLPLFGGFGEGEGLSGEVVFQPAEFAFVLVGEGLLEAEDVAVEFAGLGEVGHGVADECEFFESDAFHGG